MCVTLNLHPSHNHCNHVDVTMVIGAFQASHPKRRAKFYGTGNPQARCVCMNVWTIYSGCQPLGLSKYWCWWAEETLKVLIAIDWVFQYEWMASLHRYRPYSGRRGYAEVPIVVSTRELCRLHDKPVLWHNLCFDVHSVFNVNPDVVALGSILATLSVLVTPPPVARLTVETNRWKPWTG